MKERPVCMIWFMHTGRFRVLAALRFSAASRFIQLPSIYDADLFRRRRLAVNAACGVAQHQQGSCSSCGCSRGSLRRSCSTFLPAMRPSSIGSWRMVERSAACAISASSKPSTEMSPGTFSCCLRSSLTSAMATWSVSTQTAVGRSGSDSSFAVSCEARSDLLSGASCASAVSRLNVIPSVALACAASANAGCVGWCCRPCRPECSRCRTRCWYAPESAAIVRPWSSHWSCRC